MRYVSRPTEVEAMQWDDQFDSLQAQEIVAWVDANGGEARYEPGYRIPEGFGATQPARIAVRTINGWAHAKPGHYIVMGIATFEGDWRALPGGLRTDAVRDFYPCDPETFERRWDPAP